ncbi:MAG: hypothetical protein KDH96_07590 [Candidatus Riesia sp.]|nr:hypothetical protein [Candidatus Riesia sp.]
MARILLEPSTQIEDTLLEFEILHDLKSSENLTLAWEDFLNNFENQISTPIIMWEKL